MFLKVRMMKQNKKSILEWMKTLTLWAGKNLSLHKIPISSSKIQWKMMLIKMINKTINLTNIMKVPCKVLTKLHTFAMP